jgi:excisionase family DNA binding protein
VSDGAAPPRDRDSEPLTEPLLLLYTPEQAAERLQVRPSWLRKKAAAGLVPHHRLGRHLRFSDADLAAIIRDGAR